MTAKPLVPSGRASSDFHNAVTAYLETLVVDIERLVKNDPESAVSRAMEILPVAQAAGSKAQKLVQRLHCVRGLGSALRGDLAAAERTLQEALRFGLTGPVARLKAHLLSGCGQDAQAVTFLEGCPLEIRRELRTQLVLGQCLCSLGDSRSLEILGAVAGQDPRSDEALAALTAMARFLCERSDVESIHRAKVMLREIRKSRLRGTRESHARWIVWMLEGIVARRLGSFCEASRKLRQSANGFARAGHFPDGLVATVELCRVILRDMNKTPVAALNEVRSIWLSRVPPGSSTPLAQMVGARTPQDLMTVLDRLLAA